jgi:hypothetical protein
MATTSPTYTLLDGTTAAVDLAIAPDPVAPSTLSSVRCFAAFISVMLRRGTTQRITFCEQGWSKPTPGMRQGFVHVDGFSSKGGPLSSPLAMFLIDAPLPFVFTADTGLSLTSMLVETQDMIGARAFAEHARGIDAETYGAVSALWVVA